jgi:uncharacterized protein
VKNSYNQLHSSSKLGIVALICLLSLIVSLIIASVIAIPFFGTDSFSSIIGSSTNVGDGNINFLKFLQLVQSIGLFIIPSLLLAFLFGESVFGYLNLDKVPYLRSVILAVLIIFVANPIINLAGEINSKLTLPAGLSGLENWMRSTEEAAAQLTKLFLKTESLGGLLFNIFMIALIPAIGEEYLFRGVIQRIFKEWTKNDHWAIWISAILFSALHFQFYGFLPRVILGAMFGYLFVMSENLWLPVIAHFINNAAAVVAYYLYGEGILNVDPEKIGVDTKYHFAAIISLVSLIALYWVFNKYEANKRLKIDG